MFASSVMPGPGWFVRQLLRLRDWVTGTGSEEVLVLDEMDLEPLEELAGPAQVALPPPVPADALKPQGIPLPVAVPAPRFSSDLNRAWDDVLERAKAQLVMGPALPPPAPMPVAATPAQPRRQSNTSELRLAELMASARHARTTRATSRRAEPRRRRTTSSISLTCTPAGELTPAPVAVGGSARASRSGPR